MKQNTSFKKIALVLAALLVFIVVFAVGKPRDNYSEEEPRDADANYQGEGVVTNIASEAEVTAASTPPPGFPIIPVHPQSILVTSNVEASNYEAQWLVHQPLRLVIAWYIDNLPEFGWMITAMPDDPASITFQSTTATKDNQLLILTTSQEDDDDPTEVVVRINEQ
jgi:hypothetical protein